MFRWSTWMVVIAGSTFAQAPVTELPPLLTVPDPPAAKLAKPGCATCGPGAGEYHPGHVYLPEGNPDCRKSSCGHKGCGGECDQCRQWWFSGEFIYAFTRDLNNIDRGEAFGFRLAGGYWFDASRQFGLQTSFLNLHDPLSDFGPGATQTMAPITVTTADLNLRGQLWAQGCFRLDGTLGYRYFQLYERILTQPSPINGPPLVDAAARNNAHVGQIGLVGQYQTGSYVAELFASAGVGQVERQPKSFGVGNTTSDLTFIPEVAARVGYQLGEGAWISAGYRFLSISDVARPNFAGTQTFFLHGAMVSLELRF